MSNSPLISYTKLSPNCSSRDGARITKITPHHMAGNLSVETCGAVFAPTSRGASSNYGIGTDGRIALYVPEDKRSWASSSYANDRQAVTIEVANSAVGGDWPVSDAAWESLIALCVDICQRNGIKGLTWTGDANGSLTCHYMFKATGCPGPYLKSRMGQLADEVNRRLNNGWQPTAPGGTTSYPPSQTPNAVDGYNVWMQAKAGTKVLPTVHNNNDNAGIDSPMTYLAAWTTPGTLKVQARTKKNGWLPPLMNPSNIHDGNTGSVGDGSSMTGLKMYYYSPNGDKAIHYHVKTKKSGWLPWMIDNKDTGGSRDDFAGDGSEILRVEAYIGGLK